MSEPISKKSGFVFRKVRAERNEEFKSVMTKTRNIQSFFNVGKRIDKDQCDDNENKSSTDEKLVDAGVGDQIVSVRNISEEDERSVQQDDENNNSIDENNNSIDESLVDVGAREVNLRKISTTQPSAIDCELVRFVESGSTESLQSLFDDPTKWRKNDVTLLEEFMKRKMDQDVNQLDFSHSKRCLNGVSRTCTYGLFFKKMVNGEVHRRSWIFYSESLGKMFCVYCVFFSGTQSGPFATCGFDDWKHSNRISEHETSKSHCEAAYLFTSRISKLNKIDSELAQQVLDQQRYWKEILRRIVSTIRFLASRGLPFRGKNELVGDPGNGNYLGLLELIAEYDPLLKSHLEKYGNKGRGNTSYLSSTICDEFVEILAADVKTKILQEIRNCKYFSLIVDSTPDVAHIDQLTIVVRYVNAEGVVVERFLTFLENVGHKGKDMVDGLIQFLKDSGIIILDCRGQSYDNAKNMSGVYQGLQARIIAINPFAKYVPCGGHSLNLVLEHGAKETSEVVRFFLFVQNIYTFFAQSTKRWEILIRHLTKDLSKRKEKDPQARVLVPKRLNTTRWSARDDACRALKAGYGAVASALEEISENLDEKKATQVEARSLFDELFKLETAILLEFWSNVLHKASVTSKSLQKVDVDIKTSVLLIKSLLNYIKKFRNQESFRNFEENGRLLIQSCPQWNNKNPGLNYNCYNKRKRPRNRKYDDGKSDDSVFEDSEKFRITIFYTTLDSMISDLEKNAQNFEKVLQPFDFLFNLERTIDSDIRKGAMELKNIYFDDLDEDFIEECIHFKFFMDDVTQEIEKENETFQGESSSDDEAAETATALPKKRKKVSKPAKMLAYIKKHGITSTFPNIEVALRIFQCIAVSNCSGERSFNALKRVKNFQRSTVTVKKLNRVAILYIENDILKQLDVDLIIDKFVAAKDRKRFV